MAWFTTKKGKHINTEWFLKEEQIKRNKEIADRLNAAGGSIKGNKPQAIKGSPASIKVSGNLAKRGISNANDIEKHLRGLSPTRRNRLAKELGIEGRGEEKLKAMVNDLSSAGKPGSTIPGSQAKGIVKKTTAPEYERTPKMDWIDKRIEGKQAELNKLNKKMERIEAAKASNWEKNPYYYDEYDIVSTQKEIDSVKADIEKYKQDMETEIGKARSRNVPAITNFLNDWHDKTIEFYTNRKAEFDKAVTERNTKNTEYSRWYYSLEASKLKNEDLDAYKARTKAYKEYNKEFDEEWRDVTQFFGGSGTWENNMRKAVAQEKNRKYDDIISRTNELIGEITDAGGLSVGKSGDLNGVIVGKNGRVNLETIGAGGYNIQRYHFRTLIHKVADEPNTPDLKEQQIQMAKQEAEVRNASTTTVKPWSTAEQTRSKNITHWLMSKLNAGGSWGEFYEENLVEKLKRVPIKDKDDELLLCKMNLIYALDFDENENRVKQGKAVNGSTYYMVESSNGPIDETFWAYKTRQDAEHAMQLYIEEEKRRR